MATRTIANGGGNYNASGTWVEGVVPTSADDVVATATSGNLTVTATAAAKTLVLTNYTGTLTINASQTLTVSGSVTLVSGMALAGTGTLALAASGTLTSAGKTIPWIFSVGNVTLTLTFADDWDFGALVTIGNGSTQTLNGQTLYCGADLTIGGRVQGTTTLVLDGTGTFTGSSTASRWVSNPITVNTAGTITLAATGPNLGCTLTYTAGSVVSAGSTVYLGGSTSLVGAWSLNNLSVLATSTLTLNNPLAIGGTLTLGATLTMAGAQSVTCGTVTWSAAATLARDAGVWSITTITAAAGGTRTITGATALSCANLNVLNGATLVFPAGQTLTVTGTLLVDGISTATTAVQSGTASSAMTLALAGATAQCVRGTCTDVTVTGQTLYNYLGGTLLRTSGISNFSTTPGDSVDPGVAQVKAGTAYEINGNNLTGAYQPVFSSGSVG